MADVNRRSFFGALAAGSVALAVPVVAAIPRERAAVYVQPMCPRCCRALAWPAFPYRLAAPIGADIETTCECGWAGLARFTERQHG